MARKADTADSGQAEMVTMTREEFEKLAGAANVAQDEGLIDTLPDDEDELRALREIEGADETKWQIFRVLPPEKAGFLGSTSSAMLSLEYIGKHYGPGRYKIKGVRPNGHFAGQRTVTIAEIPEALQSARGETSSVQDVLAIIERNENKKREGIKEWAMLLIPAVSPIVAALVNRPSGNSELMGALVAALKPAPQMTLAEMTVALKNLKDMQGEGAQGSQIDSVLKVFQSVKEFADGKGSGGESSWLDLARDVIRDGLPHLKPALEALANRAAQTQPASFTPINNRPTIAPSTAADPVHSAASAVGSGTTSPASEDVFVTLAREQLNKLLDWAKAGKRIDLYAEVFLEELPEIVSQYMSPQTALTYLRSADWWERLIAFAPAAASFQSWLTAFRLELITLLQESAQPLERGSSPPQIIDSDVGV